MILIKKLVQSSIHSINWILISAIEDAKANEKSSSVAINGDRPPENRDTQTGRKEDIIDPQQLLVNRLKGQRLTLDEKRFIYDEIYKNGKEERIIKSKYLLSDATLRGIRFLFQSAKPILKGPRDELGIKVLQSKIVKRESWHFIITQKYQFTSKDV